MNKKCDNCRFCTRVNFDDDNINILSEYWCREINIPLLDKGNTVCDQHRVIKNDRRFNSFNFRPLIVEQNNVEKTIDDDREFKYLTKEFVEYIRLLGRDELKKRLKENNNYLDFTTIIDNRCMIYSMSLNRMEERNRNLFDEILEELKRLLPNSDIYPSFFYGYEVIVTLSYIE